jgi:carboxyl-terminal processing protease
MRTRSIFIGAIILLILFSGTFSAGFISGRLTSTAQAGSLMIGTGLFGSPPTSSSGSGQTATDTQTLFAPFWQTWDLLHKQYVDQPVSDELLMRGAIRGMMDSLGDPHTSYMDPEEYTSLTTQLQGEDTYEGIGAWVDTSSEYLTIISPMPGSPAEKAGLRTGDKVIAIDGQDMTGVDGELVRKKIIGPAGSTVRLRISRGGVDPFDVNIVRASINLPYVEGQMLDGNMAYVRVYIFSSNIDQQLRSTLKDLLAKSPSGLILDLRANGGGYLDSAVAVASEFIDQGVIVTEQYGDGSLQKFEAHTGGLATKIPMVVLINQGTASASEIVAGAIQDLKRGSLVGVKSFGKGSVQQPTPLVNNQGAVRITIAHWLTPNGRMINGIGLTPDYEVQITQADTDARKDPQLAKALEILGSK